MSTTKSQIFNQAADLSPKPHSGAQGRLFSLLSLLPLRGMATTQCWFASFARCHTISELHHCSFQPNNTTKMQLLQTFCKFLTGALPTQQCTSVVKVEYIVKIPKVCHIFLPDLPNTGSWDSRHRHRADFIISLTIHDAKYPVKNNLLKTKIPLAKLLFCDTIWGSMRLSYCFWLWKIKSDQNNAETV